MRDPSPHDEIPDRLDALLRALAARPESDGEDALRAYLDRLRARADVAVALP